MNLIKSICKYYLLLSVIIITLIAAGCNKPVSNAVYSDMIPDELKKIQTLYIQGHTKKVCKFSEQWIEDNPGSPHLEFALKLYADALYDREKYYEAYLKYEELLNQFGATSYFADTIKREIQIGKLFLAGQKRTLWKIFRVSARLEGLKILDDIESRWPGSKEAAKSIMLRADHYYQRHLYFEAEQEYFRILTSYKNSCHYPRALFCLAASKKNQYQGYYYDAVCLEEAEEYYKKYKLSYPERAAKLKVAQTLDWIRLEMVKKEYEIADFYYRTGKDKQAIIYWQSVFENAPETEYGQKAAELIQKVGPMSSNPKDSI